MTTIGLNSTSPTCRHKNGPTKKLTTMTTIIAKSFKKDVIPAATPAAIGVLSLDLHNNLLLTLSIKPTARPKSGPCPMKSTATIFTNWTGATTTRPSFGPVPMASFTPETADTVSSGFATTPTEQTATVAKDTVSHFGLFCYFCSLKSGDRAAGSMPGQVQSGSGRNLLRQILGMFNGGKRAIWLSKRVGLGG